MSKSDEIIVVVNREQLFENEKLHFQGSTSDKDLITKIMKNIDEHYMSMRRGSVDETDVSLEENAELNTNYKQPIPYIVVKQGDKIFSYTRLSGGGESRLHDKISLGFGGHINPLEENYYSFETVLKENTERELHEELDIKGDYDLNIIGLINDDLDEVGKVHIGILGVLELHKNGEVSIKETDQLEGKWITIEELKQEDNYNKLENWSKIVVDTL